MTGLVFLLTAVSSATAQEKPSLESLYPKKIISEIELVLGPNASFLRGNPSVENNKVMTRDPKFSYTFGVSVRHEFNQRLSLKALVLAETKGTIMNYDIYLFDEETQTSKLGSAKQDYTYKYYTLSLPVIYALGKGKQLKIGFGPYISYLKRQDIKTTYSDGVIGHTDQTEVDKPIDLGCSAFISTRYPLRKKYA